MYRRDVLIAALGALAAGPVAALGQSVTSLAALAAQAGILFGSAIDVEVLRDPDAAALYRRHSAIFTTDHSLKFGAVRPDPDQFVFGPVDDILAFAAAGGQKLRGHNLIWNDQTPKWLDPLSAADREKELVRHVETVMGRYRGRMAFWDVVNEPVCPYCGPGALRDGVWLQAMGEAYIDRAFRTARSVDPTARLCLNEAWVERPDGWGEAARGTLLALLDRLRDRGVPIDVVGLECHVEGDVGVAEDAFGTFLEALASRGLEIHITELDVIDTKLPLAIDRRDAAVAALYGKLLGVALAQKAVTTVQTWELTDRYTWLNDLPKRSAVPAFGPRPLPFDIDLKPKAAMRTLVKAFESRRRG